MDALTEFLHMGGYAFYVWSAYAITAVVLALNVWLPLRRGKTQSRRLQRILADDRSSRD